MMSFGQVRCSKITRDGRTNGRTDKTSRNAQFHLKRGRHFFFFFIFASDDSDDDEVSVRVKGENNGDDRFFFFMVMLA